MGKLSFSENSSKKHGGLHDLWCSAFLQERIPIIHSGGVAIDRSRNTSPGD